MNWGQSRRHHKRRNPLCKRKLDLVRRIGNVNLENSDKLKKAVSGLLRIVRKHSNHGQMTDEYRFAYDLLGSIQAKKDD